MTMKTAQRDFFEVAPGGKATEANSVCQGVHRPVHTVARCLNVVLLKTYVEKASIYGAPAF